jgi:hypothetical protein
MMAAPKTPDAAAQQFFQLFMSNQFAACFELFSKASQQVFLDWTLKFIYKQHPQAAEAAQLGPKEIRIMFKKNEAALIQSFWKHFYFQSGAGELYQFGYFHPYQAEGSQANVEVRMEYPNGQKGQVQLIMVKEGGGWKFGYIESGLSFETTLP